MKKVLLSIVALTGMLSGYSQVLNDDFENWTTNFLYEDPQQWETGNQNTNGTVLTTTKTTDANHGLYAARLETKLAGSDTAFAYVLLGEFGDLGPENGIPYTGGTPDSLIFWAKYDIQVGDSGTCFIASRAGGAQVAMDVFKWIGTNTGSYQRVAFEMTPGVVVDSIIVAFAAGDALNDFAIPGTWLQIDRAQVKNTTGAIFHLPNAGFEAWDSLTNETPDDWYSNNDLIVDTTIFKTTDAHSNVYAAEIKGFESDNGDTIKGFLSNAPFDFNTYWFGKMPYTSRPTQMDFFYKYAPSGSDAAVGQIQLYLEDTLIGDGVFYQPTATSTYTMGTASLNYYDPRTPDSMRIVFTSGENPGSSFLIDLVSISGGTVSIDENNSLLTSVYPNPTSNNLTINFAGKSNKNVDVSIIDLTGRTVDGFSASAGTGFNSLQYDMSSLPNRTYMFVITQGEFKTIKKIVKK